MSVQEHREKAWKDTIKKDRLDFTEENEESKGIFSFLDLYLQATQIRDRESICSIIWLREFWEF